jgi:hypothetical protein
MVQYGPGKRVVQSNTDVLSSDIKAMVSSIQILLDCHLVNAAGTNLAEVNYRPFLIPFKKISKALSKVGLRKSFFGLNLLFDSSHITRPVKIPHIISA